VLQLQECGAGRKKNGRGKRFNNKKSGWGGVGGENKKKARARQERAYSLKKYYLVVTLYNL